MALRGEATLCENAGTGNQADVRLNAAGAYVFTSEATYGGGSVKLQIKLRNGTYADVSGASQSAAGMSGLLFLPAGVYRAVNTTATAVYAYLFPVDQ